MALPVKHGVVRGVVLDTGVPASASMTVHFRRIGRRAGRAVEVVEHRRGMGRRSRGQRHRRDE
ncbi:hypothetical protein [Candidatus Mycolicibacterium alkanivorans]|uniref:Uncharacterized protein n=1 Tax=Candidatus Mycolicibacterium alkanivorans TaxID=2954114 RepID=A0ABS9YZ46_9MYCO|nr:hypothetical protein [Candidatus Mycolicibacterium alkanivorans]MCI4675993.1 hypothetical protein [Candidatus Mycolicibacterium alkanivorans]